MKRSHILAVALALGFNIASAQTANIDTKKSSVEWTGSKVTGTHTGTINVSQGTISLKDNALSVVDITIDMTSIKNTDLDGGAATKLEGHLHSADFFNTKEYKTATFKSTAVKPTAKGYEVTGDLTIKGKTEPISFTVSTAMYGQTILATGTLIFDRAKFDVKYGSGSFFDDLGDKVIDDDVKLAFNIVTLAE